MKILVLGGTAFLGRALVDAALVSGHELTLFNRGKTNAELYPDVEKLHGDRATDFLILKNRKWDVVIDTCGYVPRIVNMSAQALLKSVEHYVFVSTLSVYSDLRQTDIDEDAPVGVLADEQIEEINSETYGPLKVLCEHAVESVFPGRSLIIRPGLIVGPYDPSDRFTYWVNRVARGGDIVSPGRPKRVIQFIDVRDLAEWMIRMAEEKRTGIWNADGPTAGTYSMGDLLDTCVQVCNENAHLVWIDDSFLQAQNVGEWMEMPLWLAENNPDKRGSFSFSTHKARKTGLCFRSVTDTVRDTLAWNQRRPEHTWRTGLDAVREADLLRMWKETQSI